LIVGFNAEIRENPFVGILYALLAQISEVTVLRIFAASSLPVLRNLLPIGPISGILPLVDEAKVTRYGSLRLGGLSQISTNAARHNAVC